MSFMKIGMTIAFLFIEVALIIDQSLELPFKLGFTGLMIAIYCVIYGMITSLED